MLIMLLLQSLYKHTFQNLHDSDNWNAKQVEDENNLMLDLILFQMVLIF